MAVIYCISGSVCATTLIFEFGVKIKTQICTVSGSAPRASYTCPSRFPLVGRAAISHTHMARSLSCGVSTRGDWKQLLSPFRQIGPICYVPPGHGPGGDFVFD